MFLLRCVVCTITHQRPATSMSALWGLGRVSSASLACWHLSHILRLGHPQASTVETPIFQMRRPGLESLGAVQGHPASTVLGLHLESLPWFPSLISLHGAFTESLFSARKTAWALVLQVTLHGCRSWHRWAGMPSEHQPLSRSPCYFSIVSLCGHS